LVLLCQGKRTRRIVCLGQAKIPKGKIKEKRARLSKSEAFEKNLRSEFKATEHKKRRNQSFQNTALQVKP
jgi:hypothetical protein